MGNIDFGRGLRFVLDDIGWTQKDLSEFANITPACISQVINNKREPTLSTIVKILNATGFSFEEIMNARPEVTQQRSER